MQPFFTSVWEWNTLDNDHEFFHYTDNIDDCSPNPCQNGGICVDQTNSYTCNCETGYDGAQCQSKHIVDQKFDGYP